MSSNLKFDIWKEKIADYRSSKLKAQEWCDKNNVSVKTLYYWMRRVNKETETPGNIPNEFVSVMTQDIMLNPAISVVIRLGKIEIDVPDNCHVDTFRKLLEALSIYA